MPAGLGWHPFFLAVGPAEVTFTAEAWWPHASDYLPIGQPQPLGDDLRPPLVVSEKGLTAYFGRWSGGARVLREDGARIALIADRIFDHLVVHRPANATYLCIEPVTHVADGFNLAASGVRGAGLCALEPGEELTGTLCVALSEADAR